jgi:hypothetical protein
MKTKEVMHTVNETCVFPQLIQILDAVTPMSLLIYQFVTMKANVIKRKQLAVSFLLWIRSEEEMHRHSFIRRA